MSYQGEGIFNSIKRGEHTVILQVPSWAWENKLAIINEILEGENNEKNPNVKKLFQSDSRNKPLILEDCTLFIRLDYYAIGRTYLFRSNRTYVIQQFPAISISKRFSGEISNIGYFTSTLLYKDFLDKFMSETKMINTEEVSIIGYSNGNRYMVSGISMSNMVAFPGFTARFTFDEYKLLNR